MLRFDPAHLPNRPHDIAAMIDSGILEISEAVDAAIPGDQITLAFRRFLCGDWGKVSTADRENHAFRYGFHLLACHGRLHFLSDYGRTMTRIVLSSEI